MIEFTNHINRQAMKPTAFIFMMAALLFSACSTTRQTARTSADDVYFSSADARREREEAAARRNNNSVNRTSDFTQSNEQPINDGIITMEMLKTERLSLMFVMILITMIITITPIPPD
jgi:hypothetical protein